MKPKRLLPTLAAALVLSTTTGCFNYVPTEIGAVPPGESVRLFLTRAGVDSEADDYCDRDRCDGSTGQAISTNGLNIYGE